MKRSKLASRPVWRAAIKAAADPGRAGTRLALLEETPAAEFFRDAGKEQARLLCALFSGAQALSGALAAKPELIHDLTPDGLARPRRKAGLLHQIDSWLPPALNNRDYAAALRAIREFKERETVRIGARDLARFSTVQEITMELSDLADVCLSGVWNTVLLQLTERLGSPCHQARDGSWQRTEACVLGLGKLGGQELNYSSDVDVIFVYSDEGGVFREIPTRRATPKSLMSNHQFYNRLAEAFIAEVTRMTPEGSLYRIDLRLRPEGDSGPLSRSISSYENYYAQWGQTWERMMLIKARNVAGDGNVAGEFLEMIQPFRYPRSINTAVLREVAGMKDRIEAEVVKAGELDRNVKLGRGGIREVEFVVQSIQLLHAGKQPFLQSARTLPTIEKLVSYEHLSARDARTLIDAYCFLRDVEHRLQMDDNRQTHTIPHDKAAVLRLSRLMGFDAVSAFESAKQKHAGNVRAVFERMLRPDKPEEQGARDFPKGFEGEEGAWKQLLERHKFRDLDKAFRVLREFVEGPGYVHVSPRTKDLAHNLLPNLFALCPDAERSSPPDGRPPLSDPDRVVTRLDSFIAAYGARSTLFELWHSNPSIFELLILLFDRSEFLAELAIRTPDLVDELVSSDRLRRKKTRDETLQDLLHGIGDADQHLWLRRYHQAELMRIGLRDILGLADPEQYLVELSTLADACLAYALEVAMRRHKLKQPPFCIVGLGKLGGAEIDYGSDLDIIFVAGLKARDLSKPSKMAVEIMDLLSARTEKGIVFQTDARLRPDGEKGLLVNTLKAYEDYYRNRALLWEIQALSRSRPIAGDAQTSHAFDSLAGRLSNFREPSLPLAACTPEWKSTIRQMRLRIEKERTPKGKEHLAIKTGAGGLVDAEFIAQALCLEHGWREPNTLQAIERGNTEGVLRGGDILVKEYRFLRRVEGILRRWSYEGETVLPDQPEPFYRVAVRCGFAGASEFEQALARARSAIREAFDAFFVTTT
jgi:glutamate-ammonia-ligase adenylyltransferase